MHLREKEMGRGLRSEKERRERYGEVNITELAAEYYFLNFCEGIIRQIEDHSPDYRTHLTFREASEIFSIHQLSARIRRQLTDFFKEYLLLAIRSEVGEVWESVLNLPLNRSLRRDVVSLYESGNSEDILHYIARAHKRFGDFQWILPAFGGPLWAEISKVALKLWRDTETAPDHIIDHIFDLQHNGLVNGSQSYIFDKDPKESLFIHVNLRGS